MPAPQIARAKLIPMNGDQVETDESKHIDVQFNPATLRVTLSNTLKADNRAVHQWSLDNGSEFMAGDLLSGLTGNRAAMGLIDDPIRGREAAQSETIRNKTWEF